MKTHHNLTIGILSTTAVVLLMAVAAAFFCGERETLAFGQIDRGGDYIVVTGQFTLNSEVVYVTDAAARRLNMYSYDRTRQELRLWDSMDLPKVFAGAPR